MFAFSKLPSKILILVLIKNLLSHTHTIEGATATEKTFWNINLL